MVLLLSGSGRPAAVRPPDHLNVKTEGKAPHLSLGVLWVTISCLEAKFLSIFKTGNEILQTGNGIIQTGNGIISPTSWPLIRKLLLQNVSHFYQGVRIQFFKQEMEIFKQDMDLFLHFQVSDKKNFFY